jgi:hypothetical protein
MEARFPTECADMAWLAGVDVTVDGDEDVGFLFALPLAVGLLCDLAFFPGAPDSGTPCSQTVGARRGGQVASIAAAATVATGIAAVILPPLLRYLGRLGLEEMLVGGRRHVGHVFCESRLG